MSDNLTLTSGGVTLDLLSDTYCLGSGYTFGDSKPDTAVIESLLLDGEPVQVDRFGNRELVLPIHVKVPEGEADRLALSAATSALVEAVQTHAHFTLTWTPDGGLPMIWDCYAGAAAVGWSQLEEKWLTQTVTLTFPAAPFGRSPDAVTPDLTLIQSTTRGRVFEIGEVVGSARAPAGIALPFSAAVTAWLLHRPPADADPDAPILRDLTAHTVTIADAEKLRGTYTVVLGVSTYDAPGEARTVEVTVGQDGTDIEQTISKAYTSTLETKHLVVGNITLPLVDRPAGATTSLTVVVDDSGTSSYLAVMLLDTRGQTVQSMQQVAGVAGTVAAFVDEPEPGAVVGQIWNSPTTDREDAYAATEPRMAGGPLVLSKRDEGGVLLVYTTGSGVAQTPALGYHPRWLAERTE